MSIKNWNGVSRERRKRDWREKHNKIRNQEIAQRCEDCDWYECGQCTFKGECRKR